MFNWWGRRFRLPCVAATVMLVGCSSPPPLPLNEAVTCLPPDTVAIAGIYLERVRSKESYGRLPPAWSFAFEAFRSANLVLLAYNGSDLLVIASGRFSTAPPGVQLLTPQLALAGSPASIRAATAQHASGRTGAPELVGQAAPVTDKDIWAVVRGGTRLPFPGNGANVNRLLALTQYTTASGTLDSAIRLEADGHCATPESARELEEHLRALITLGKAAAKARDLASLLASVELRRERNQVSVGFVASPQALEELFR